MSRTSSELAHASPCAKAHQGTTEEARDWQCMLYHTRADCCALLALPAIPRFHGTTRPPRMPAARYRREGGFLIRMPTYMHFPMDPCALACFAPATLSILRGLDRRG